MKFSFDFIKNIFSKKNKFVCPGAFSQVYIYPDGRVFLCPDCFMTPDSCIGNLNENTFEEIYNSDIAIKLRKDILQGKYTKCNPVACFSKSNYNARLIPKDGLEYKVIQTKFPKMVCIGPDAECNVNCVMCRGQICRLTDEEIQEYNKKIDELYLPILKDAEVLTLSTTSDPFASRNTRLLMKRAAETYPNLRFSLLTNGVLCDKFNCDEVGITDRLEYVMFSIHGSNEETYNKIVKNGNFKKVVENLKWVKSLKQEKKIKGLFLAFVVSSKNYDDIPQFVEFAKEHDAVALFWPCVDWGGNLKYSDEPLSIVYPQNPKFNLFLDIINSIELETDYSHFSLPIKNLKKIFQQKKEG